MQDGLKVKLSELQISDDVMGIVRREVDRLNRIEEALSTDQLMKLEKLTKVYGLLMSSLRENIKNKLFGSLSDEDLEPFEEVSEGAESTTSSDETEGDLSEQLPGFD